MFPSETLKHLLRSLNPRINNHTYIIMQNISEQTKAQGFNRATLGQEICTQSIVNTTSTEARKSSENVTSQFSIISQLFKAIVLAECVPTFLEINWNKSFRNKQTKLNICHHAHVVHTAAKPVFSRRRENENDCKMSKNEKCTCKACKTYVFHCQICKFVTFLLSSSLWLLQLPNKQKTVKCCNGPTNETSLRKQVKRKGKQQAHVQFTNTLV